MVFRHMGPPLGALALLAALTTAASAQEETATPPRLPLPVETQELRQLDAWTVGALSRNEGMAPELWSRSDPAFLATLFDRLPTVYESPAVQSLALRVLLSSGEAPPGEAQPAARKRFEALGRMGAADSLANMAAGAGAALSDPAIAQYAAQAELARGRRTEACQRGRAAPVDPPSPFFLRLRAFCAAAAGDRPAAELALELARSGGADDAWYTGAVAAAGGAPGARPPTARYDNSLNVQLSIAAGLRPGPTPLNNASSLALVALARNETAPQPARAQAAALSFRRGGISAADARTILLATPPEITSGLPPIVVALRQVQATPGTLEAATAIAGELRRATTPGDFAAASRFFRADIAALTTAPDPSAALMFARAALAAGDAELSARLLQSASATGLTQASLAPLGAALAVAQNVRGNRARAAVAERISGAGASLARAGARDVAIMAAMGFPTDGAAQTFLLANPPQGGVRAEPGAMAALGAAIARRAPGEAALLAVVAAGNGPGTLDADSVCEIIRTLRALQLEDEARRFAVEALLAGQPAA
ncbi:MAG: hypothetical protein WDM79_12155 [Terricaulis sp.]